MERFGGGGMILRGEIEWLGNRMVKWGGERVMELQREKIYESCAHSEEERGPLWFIFHKGLQGRRGSVKM